MAEIFLARHKSVEGFERNLVIKRILPELAEDPEFVESFLNEAKLSAQLTHPNIVQIYDLGRIQKSYFIAMEYIRGFDLASLLRRERRQETFMPLDIGLRIFADVCAGLDFAHHATDVDGHSLDVVHRDVTPSNVLVSTEGPAKLVDFGIAKATAKGDGNTKTGTVKGKFAYLSPEQVLGKHLDKRSDVFACGIMLYEILANRNPFRGDTEYQSLQNIMSLNVPPISETRADVPVAFDAVVSKALQRDVADRFNTCREMLAAVEEEARTSGIALSHGTVHDYLAAHETELQAQEETRDNTSDMNGAILDIASGKTSTQKQQGTSFFNALGKKWAPVVGGSALLMAVLIAIMTFGKGAGALRMQTADAPRDTGLQVGTDPQGASVLLDGVLYSGKTPLVVKDLQIGKSFDVEVRLPGYRPAHTRVHLEKPDLLPVELSLAQDAKLPAAQPLLARVETRTRTRGETAAAPSGPGKLRVVVQPWGSVEIDGARVGDTPFPPKELQSGVHTVVIENAELKKRVTKKVNISAGQEFVLHENFMSE